jgi:pimeloyl-ACP methyl ester carboxylesterase
MQSGSDDPTGLCYERPMGDGRIHVSDGRTVGFTDLGPVGAPAILWCHGGPGSRVEPAAMAPAAVAAGFRIVGIDRPGYGWSTPLPERTIADWVPDGLAVADHLGLERFVAIGVSTGGAYALAMAAMAPERVIGVVACCALTDMRWTEGKALMGTGRTDEIWNAPDRDTALAIATEVFGADGSQMAAMVGEAGMAPADMALFSDEAFIAGWMAGLPEMFAHGVAGYTDDRRADGPGWGSFDVSAVTCPVLIVHGGADTIVPVANAHHTAELLPGAVVRIFPDHGHLSVIAEVVPAALALRPNS